MNIYSTPCLRGQTDNVLLDSGHCTTLLEVVPSKYSSRGKCSGVTIHDANTVASSPRTLLYMHCVHKHVWVHVHNTALRRLIVVRQRSHCHMILRQAYTQPHAAQLSTISVRARPVVVLRHATVVGFPPTHRHIIINGSYECL